ncbi:MAG: pyridoxal phosphate-dependent aminotransferase [Candidatus Micrarchaeota archaeon]
MHEFGPSLFIGKNKGYISFGSGQPDLAPPKRIFGVDKRFRVFKYGLVRGEEKLRVGVAKAMREYGHKFSARNIVITNGASEALDLTFGALLGKDGGKVLLTVPYYYTYPTLIAKNRGRAVYTKLVDGHIDLEDFRAKLEGAKVALVNSPANPTGCVQPRKTLEEIEKMTRDLGVKLISDEVYSNLIYEGEHYSPKGEHVITLNSFSKTFAMCGLRVGYCCANEEIVEKVVGLKTATSMNTSVLGQEMAYEALKVPHSYVKRQLEVFRKRRDLVYNGLMEMGLELWKPEGAFYALPKVKNPKKTVWELYSKHRVITYCGEWFGAPKRIRLSYALNSAMIGKGLKNIENYLKRH